MSKDLGFERIIKEKSIDLEILIFDHQRKGEIFSFEPEYILRSDL